MKKILVSILAVLTLFAVWACNEDSVGQETLEENEKAAAGTYLIMQNDGFQQLLTLADGRVAFSQNSDQRSLPAPFGDQQGAWKVTGDREVKVRTLDFVYDFDDGTLTGYGLSTFIGTFDMDFSEFTGTVLVEIFGTEQDPLDPDEEPGNTFGPISFDGRRVTAD